MIDAVVARLALGIVPTTLVDQVTSQDNAIAGDGTVAWGTIFAVIAIILVVVAAWYMRRTVRNWTGSFQVRKWAAEHRMHYVERNNELSLNWAESPFGYAARTCYNVVHGEYRGHPTTIFDLGDLSSSSTASQLLFSPKSDMQEQLHGHVASVALMNLPFFIETDLTLRPLKGLSRLWAHDGGQQHIELENEDFNRLYDVICADRDLAYSFITARTIEVLLSQPPVEIRVRGMQVLLIDDEALRPDRMNRWLAMLSAVVENVSPYVWTDRGTQVVADLEVGRPTTAEDRTSTT